MINETINALVQYIGSTNSLGMEIGSLKTVHGDGTNIVNGVEQVCSQLASMIEAGTPPDLILDTTKVGDFSDPIKSLTKSLGLPSVALSYGGKGMLR